MEGAEGAGAVGRLHYPDDARYGRGRSHRGQGRDREGGRALYEGPPRDLVSKVPFAYRAVVRKPAPPALDHAVDLGDRLIVYFRKRSEFDDFVGSLEDLSQLLAAGSVGLEDAFILLLGGGAA